MNLNEVTARIVGWANDRNLILGATYKAQCIKLGEELGEAFEAIDKEDEAEFKDAIGDMYVVASIMCAQLGSSIILARELAEQRPNITQSMEAAFGRVCGAVARGKEADLMYLLGEFVNHMDNQLKDQFEDGAPALLDCVLGAWDVIKDRKGRMVDGVFIKEGEK